jgi:hypothetical protein
MTTWQHSQDREGPIRAAEKAARKVHYEFCPQCGATIRWRIDIVPNRQVFAGGAFDDIRESKKTVPGAFEVPR